jgi:hypothetical protein
MARSLHGQAVNRFARAARGGSELAGTRVNGDHWQLRVALPEHTHQ